MITCFLFDVYCLLIWLFDGCVCMPCPLDFGFKEWLFANNVTGLFYVVIVLCGLVRVVADGCTLLLELVVFDLGCDLLFCLIDGVAA